MDDPHVLKKNGMYYRPFAQGYTDDLSRAGWFSGDEARAHVNGCSGEVRAIPRADLIDELADQISETRGSLARMEGIMSEIQSSVSLDEHEPGTEQKD